MSDTRIVTVADSKCEAIVFMLPTGGAQVVVTGDSLRRNIPTTVNVDPPPKGRRIAVVRYPDGALEVVYRDIEFNAEKSRDRDV
jgi:hypothetical protein